MASTVSGSTAFTLQTDPETGAIKRRLEDITTFLFDAEERKILGKTPEQWSKFEERRGSMKEERSEQSSGNMTKEEKKERMENMTPEEREQMKEKKQMKGDKPQVNEKDRSDKRDKMEDKKVDNNKNETRGDN